MNSKEGSFIFQDFHQIGHEDLHAAIKKEPVNPLGQSNTWAESYYMNQNVNPQEDATLINCRSGSYQLHNTAHTIAPSRVSSSGFWFHCFAVISYNVRVYYEFPGL